MRRLREKTGEATMDIYKYISYYLRGALTEPLPHLFLIADEFAELKDQQPEFMDELMSAARIGRSLGVHLILATQKPSGVVNDQIRSNMRLKVCLKVADAGDSKEMIGRTDAARSAIQADSTCSWIQRVLHRRAGRLCGRPIRPNRAVRTQAR